MTPGAVLAVLDAAGISLQCQDGFLKCRGNRGAYTDEIRSLVGHYRWTFIKDWRCCACGVITTVLYGWPGGIVVCRACHLPPEEGP